MSSVLKYHKNYRVIAALAIFGLFAACIAGTASAQLVDYDSGGFESIDPNADPIDPNNGTLLGDDGWLVGSNVFTRDPLANYRGVGGFVYNYFAFPAPNGTGGFSNITFDGSDPNNGGDPPNGDRGIVVFSDYLNGDHDPNSGRRLESVFFREWTVAAGDVGKTAKFTFVAKKDNLEGDSKAHGRITVINPSTGFSLSAIRSVETTATPASNTTYELSLPITQDLVGQLFQTGFDNFSDSFNGSGVDYDDVKVEFLDTFGSYTQDFESVTSADEDALNRNGWKVFGAVFTDPNDVAPRFTYGTFGAPNTASPFSTAGNQFSAVAPSEGGAAQGTQALNTFSDYECCTGGTEGHGSGTDLVVSSIFQEFIIGSDDPNRQMSFSFDAKLPTTGGLDPSADAEFYIRTLDPNAGFATTAESIVDASTLGLNTSSYVSGEVLFDILPSMVGQLIQFGITNKSSNFDATGVLLDNISFDDAAVGLTGDFNGDGTVDALDFLEWQRNPSVGSLSDWEMNYGATLATAAVSAVPEPSTGLLCLISASLLSTVRRRSIK